MPKLMEFCGTWALERQIDDARAGTRAQFTGQARFEPEAGGLTYDEAGVLRLPGQAPVAATRRYLWRTDGDGIAVCFADGRAFHRIAAGARPSDRHLCDPDTYDVSYDFTAWPVWHADWRVFGPRKDYVMRSTFTRLS